MDMMKNTLDCLKGIKITKQCDSQLKLVCDKCNSEPITLTMKEDYSINMLHLFIGIAAGTVMLTSLAIIKKLKN
jgi:hypothetical protein